MLPPIRSIVASVVATIVPELELPGGVPRDDEAFASNFVIAQIDRMPAHLHAAMLGLEAIFDAGAVVRHGKPFTRLPEESRRAYLAAWARSKVGTQRDYVRFHRSLTIFALYSKRSSPA